jgi:hypothetical protein
MGTKPGGRDLLLAHLADPEGPVVDATESFLDLVNEPALPVPDAQLEAAVRPTKM